MSTLPVQQVLEFGRVVAAVHDETLVLIVELGLRAQFAPEVLGWIWNGVQLRSKPEFNSFEHYQVDKWCDRSLSFWPTLSRSFVMSIPPISLKISQYRFQWQ